MTVVAMDVAAEPADGVDEQLVRQLVESALEGEMDDHLGYSNHDSAGRNGGIPGMGRG